jgi:hypothetical protein
MYRQGERQRRRRGTLAALVLAAAVSGCASSAVPPSGDAPPSRIDSFSDKFMQLLAGPKPQTSPTALAFNYECPEVTVRPGASTLAVNANDADASATMSLRYQATVSQTARECDALAGGAALIKVGVQGRVILGPAGGPGVLNVPLRYALVKEGVEPRTIWTRLYRFNVDIPPGQGSVAFTHVEEDMTITPQQVNDIDNYVVYIGFDPTGAAEEDKLKKPPPKPKPKGKPVRPAPVPLPEGMRR